MPAQQQHYTQAGCGLACNRCGEVYYWWGHPAEYKTEDEETAKAKHARTCKPREATAQ